MDVNQTQQQSSGLVHTQAEVVRNKEGLGAIPFFGSADGTNLLDSLSTWLATAIKFVEDNPLLALGVGVSLIMLVSDKYANRGR